MFDFLREEMNEIYRDDQKKLRTNTVLYGHLGEGRWHSTLQPPLTEEEVQRFEKVLDQSFHSSYREFLKAYNGCWLFDLLRIAGKDAETYKGLNSEEQVHLAFNLESMQGLYRKKRTPSDHFIFADSFVKNTYYVIKADEQVLEIDFRTKKVIQTFQDFRTFLKEFIREGKKDIEEGTYYEFE
ncbi:SMI1/KNR4 family protein [Bacillus marinisedimentorum]|uniref:SMI1/KNR4 family protein n=1 Tax=Bacillus marinisedimentorum TaxID=1821260 RepID=UPI0007DFE321|nr:SMI1/KNR4 family protein [Bacillus marinisedimentorum]